MSNDSKNSLLTRAWHVVLGVFASAILLTLTVEIVKAYWMWLVGAVLLVVLVIVAVMLVRWWLSRRRW